MNSRLMIGLCSTALLGFAVAFTAPVSAQEKRTKSCTTQWRDMTKAEKKDLKKKDWVADCEAKAGGGTKTTAPTTTATPPATAGGEVKGKPGRAAMIARERACGKEWREAKAAGKIEKGQTWPKYWSECNKRMKEQGM
jgi:K+-sensing histidine kinase KdpD